MNIRIQIIAAVIVLTALCVIVNYDTIKRLNFAMPLHG